MAGFEVSAFVSWNAAHWRWPGESFPPRSSAGVTDVLDKESRVCDAPKSLAFLPFFGFSYLEMDIAKGRRNKEDKQQQQGERAIHRFIL